MIFVVCILDAKVLFCTKYFHEHHSKTATTANKHPCYCSKQTKDWKDEQQHLTVLRHLISLISKFSA